MLWIKSLFADPYGAPAMIRRLILEFGWPHRKQYALSLVLMGVSAAAMAASAYIFRDVINAAYINRSFTRLYQLALIIVVISVIKGIASYVATITLARVGNRIVAANQRSMFDKLLNESVGFFANRHSSEFAMRLVTGATAVNQVLTLLIGAIGRDFLTLVGLMIVMLIQDPLLFLVSFIVFPPTLLVLRQDLSTASARSHAASSPAAHAPWRRCRKCCKASAS